MIKGLDLIKRQQPEFINDFPTGNICIGVSEEELIELEQELKEYEQYKALEEELGIGLIVFGKILQALDSECVYVKIKETKQYDGYSLNEETGEIRRCVIVRFSRYINGLRDWFFTISWGDLSSAKQYLLKDYGKTWALTKEELL